MNISGNDGFNSLSISRRPVVFWQLVYCHMSSAQKVNEILLVQTSTVTKIPRNSLDFLLEGDLHWKSTKRKQKESKFHFFSLSFSDIKSTLLAVKNLCLLGAVKQ